MSATHETPIDRFSGIPLPLSPIYMSERPNRYSSDEHHPWHDRLNPMLQGLGGKALRGSRIQLANYDAHHLDYHRYYIGPKLPENDKDRLRPIVMAVAGYIPDEAIEFDGDGYPQQVALSIEDRNALRASNRIRVEHPQHVRDFLREYTFGQDLSDVSDSTIDEFINTVNSDRRWLLGNELLARATRIAAEPIVPVYRKAFKEELIPSNRAQNAARFMLSSLGMKRHRQRLHEQLREHLLQIA